MHILIALTYYRPHYSGLTIYAEREARALAARGHQVTVLTSRFDDSLPEREQWDGVTVIRPKVRLRLSKGVVMPSMPVWALRLARQADVVHLHVPQLDAAYIALIGRLLRKPVVMTYHCDMRLPAGLVHATANFVSNMANHLTASAANVIVHNTRDYAEHSPFLQRYLHKLHPIFPPIQVPPVSAADRQAFRQRFGLQPGQRLIGLAARLATEKGVEYLVEAMPRVLERFPQARVIVMGPYQAVLGEEAYARRLMPLIEQLGEHWSFLGVLSPVEMAAFFHECEVTVLPSINSTESYGMVQVEAMACGTPVVASDLPGVRVPVTMTGAGCIFPARDAGRLADAVIAVLSNPEAYTGQVGELVRLSSLEAVGEAYERLFKQLLREYGAQGAALRTD